MRFVLIFALCVVCSASIAQERDSSFVKQQDSSLSILEYFIQNDVSEVSMKTNVKGLYKNKFKEIYQFAEFSFPENDSTSYSFEIKVRARGNMRKKVCQHAPLKLNFSKSDLVVRDFKPIDKYKLVCQCTSGKSGEQLLLKEFLAYQLYNIITDNSFKTHLFAIHYIDTKGKKTRTRYGFLIENDDELAARLNSSVIAVDSLKFKNIKRRNMVQLGMFQYMIGNTDYSLKEMHNLKAIQPINSNNAILIAYDFDSSGLVDARYALPNPMLPIQDVKDRWFNMKGCSRKEIQQHVDHFQNRKMEILDFCQKYSILNNQSHITTMEYIEGFYKIIEDPNEVKEQFVHN